MTEIYSNKDLFNNLIEKVTITWKPVIINFLEQLYINRWIPSHDINHHQRVWRNAVEICRQIQNKSPGFKQSFYEELIISCFFHDSGLLIDPGEHHGNESRRIAEEFLSTYSGKIGFDKAAVLSAIEKHDDKNYLLGNANNNLLLEILSLADDIDALGATGLYRYIEIYLLRGIIEDKIPELIINNVEKRYRNLEGCLKKYHVFSMPYFQLYNDLANLVKDDSFSENPVSLVKWIDAEIVRKKENPDIIIMSREVSGIGNQRILKFIKKYRDENPISRK